MQPQYQPQQPYGGPGPQQPQTPPQPPTQPQSPQPGQTNQPKPKKKRSAKLPLIIGIVITSLLIIGCIVCWIMLDQEKSSDDGTVSTEVAQLLTPERSVPVPVEVSSTLGVKVPFNGYELAGFALADGTAYTGSDLIASRDYSVIRIRPVETSEATRSQLSLALPNLRLTASNDAEYWDKVQADEELAELSKADAVIEQTKTQRLEANDKLDVSDVSRVEMGEVQYSKISFTLKDENFGVTSSVREDCYVTIQNDRPYVACINNIRPSNFSVASQLEQTLSDVTYTSIDQDSLVSGVSEEDGAALVGGDEEEEEVADEGEQATADDIEAAREDEGVSEEVERRYLPKSSQDFARLAKIAPSVARIGTIYCADVKLTYPASQQGVTLTGACSDIAGTGFYVSTEGLLATAASNVSVRPAEAITSYIVNAPSSSLSQERLDRVLNYLVEARYIMESDADGIKTGVQQGDTEAIAKVRVLADRIGTSNITIESESYSHALQLGSSPIVVNANANGSLSFAFSDSVVELEKVATDYDPNRSQTSVFDGSDKSSDLALMKTKREVNRPALSISNGTFNAGAKMYAAGLPMYADSNLESGQLSSNPMPRFGEVQNIFDTEGSKVASVLMASHAGLRGAPAVNESGQVVGVMGHNNLACPESSCVSGSMIESANGIIGLARSKNVALASNSPVVDTWNRAIDAFVIGNYREAIDLFNGVKATDPHNQLVAGFVGYAQEARNGEDDTSNINLILTVVKAALVVLVILLILLVLGLLATKLFQKSSRGRGPKPPVGGQDAESLPPAQPQMYQQANQSSNLNQGYGPQSQQDNQPVHPAFQQVNDLYNIGGQSSAGNQPSQTQPPQGSNNNQNQPPYRR